MTLDPKKRHLLERLIVEGAEREEMTASISWWSRFEDIVGFDDEEMLDDIGEEMDEELAMWREEHEDA